MLTLVSRQVEILLQGGARCGRYRRTTREEELAPIYRIPIPSQPDLAISYNIAPSQEVLAIRFKPDEFFLRVAGGSDSSGPPRPPCSANAEFAHFFQNFID